MQMAYFRNDSIMTAYFARMQPPGVADANIFAKEKNKNKKPNVQCDYISLSKISFRLNLRHILTHHLEKLTKQTKTEVASTQKETDIDPQTMDKLPIKLHSLF